MKLQFLGTSAGECYPALWCECANCRYAREHGGKNIRLNSCAVLDDDILIDMNATCFSVAQALGTDLIHRDKLFVTHDHKDHFYPQHLVWRSQPFHSQHGAPDRPVEDIRAWNDVMGPRFSPVPFLHIYGHPTILEAIAANSRLDIHTMAEKQLMDLTALIPGQVVETDDLRVTVLRSNHSKPGTVFNYIFERGGKTLLYALDCGGYDEEMLALIRQTRYDCVVLEGTFGKHQTDFDFHMNQRGNLRMLAYFTDHNLWTGKPNLWLSHMAPHWTPPHDQYEQEMAAFGIGVAYDGLTLNI